jgi:hypothetical protein
MFYNFVVLLLVRKKQREKIKRVNRTCSVFFLMREKILCAIFGVTAL